MIRNFIFYCFILFPVLIAAQQKNKVLEKSLSNARNYSDSSVIIREFIKENDFQNPEEPLKLLQDAKNLLAGENDKKLWADFYFDAGEIYYNYAEIDKATESYIKSYDYYKSTNLSTKPLIERKLAGIYTNTGYYQQAEDYLMKSYKHSVKNNDKANEARAELSLGWLYYQMFMVKDDSTKLMPSLEYSKKAHGWVEKNGDDQTRVKLNVTIAEAMSFTDQMDSSFYYYDKAIQLAETSKTLDERAKAFVYNQYARHLFDIGETELAVVNAEKAFEIVKDFESFEKLDVAKTLYKIYIGNKDYEKAANFFEKYTELQDSLQQMEQFANINTLIHQQENPRKASWIEKNWVWLSALVIIAFISVFFFVKMNQRRKLKEAQNELNILSRKIAALNSEVSVYENEINQLRNESEVNMDAMERKENQLKEILQKPLLTDDQWLKFKRSFEMVNKGYSHKISQNFTNVSQAELRYLYLLKLGMSHKEIAATLGISPDSVRLYKHRLGKKVNPGKENILPVLFENN